MSMQMEEVQPIEDLEPAILDMFWVDAFKPKICHEKDILVVAFLTTHPQDAEELQRYIATSPASIVAAEASTEPDEDGFYFVIVELDRQKTMYNELTVLLETIQPLTQIDSWYFKPFDYDEYFEWNETHFGETVPQDPLEYEDQQPKIFVTAEADEADDVADVDHMAGPSITDHEVGDLSELSRSINSQLRKQFSHLIKLNQRLLKKFDKLQTDHKYLQRQLKLYQKREKLALIRERQDLQRIRRLEGDISMLAYSNAGTRNVVINESGKAPGVLTADQSVPADGATPSPGSIDDSSYDTQAADHHFVHTGVEDAYMGPQDTIPSDHPDQKPDADDGVYAAESVDDDDVIDLEDPLESQAELEQQWDEDHPGAESVDSRREDSGSAANEDHDRAESAVPPEETRSSFAKGMQALKSKQYDAAIDYFSAVDRESEEAARANYNLAVLFYMRKNYEAANRYAEQAFSGGVQSAEQILEFSRNKQQELQELIQAQAADTQSAAEATEPEEQVQEEPHPIGPTRSEPTPHPDPASTRPESANDQPIETHVSETPESDLDAYYYALGQAALEKGDLATAIDYFSAVEKNAHQAPTSRYYLAILHMRQNMYSEARQWAIKARDMGVARAQKIIELIDSRDNGGTESRMRDAVRSAAIGDRPSATAAASEQGLDSSDPTVDQPGVGRGDIGREQPDMEAGVPDYLQMSQDMNDSRPNVAEQGVGAPHTVSESKNRAVPEPPTAQPAADQADAGVVDVEEDLVELTDYPDEPVVSEPDGDAPASKAADAAMPVEAVEEEVVDLSEDNAEAHGAASAQYEAKDGANNADSEVLGEKEDVVDLIEDSSRQIEAGPDDEAARVMSDDVDTAAAAEDIPVAKSEDVEDADSIIDHADAVAAAVEEDVQKGPEVLQVLAGERKRKEEESTPAAEATDTSKDTLTKPGAGGKTAETNDLPEEEIAAAPKDPSAGSDPAPLDMDAGAVETQDSPAKDRVQPGEEDALEPVEEYEASETGLEGEDVESPIPEAKSGNDHTDAGALEDYMEDIPVPDQDVIAEVESKTELSSPTVPESLNEAEFGAQPPETDDQSAGPSDTLTGAADLAPEQRMQAGDREPVDESHKDNDAVISSPDLETSDEPTGPSDYLNTDAKDKDAYDPVQVEMNGPEDGEDLYEPSPPSSAEEAVMPPGEIRNGQDLEASVEAPADEDGETTEQSAETELSQGQKRAVQANEQAEDTAQDTEVPEAEAEPEPEEDSSLADVYDVLVGATEDSETPDAPSDPAPTASEAPETATEPIASPVAKSDDVPRTGAEDRSEAADTEKTDDAPERKDTRSAPLGDDTPEKETVETPSEAPGPTGPEAIQTPGVAPDSPAEGPSDDDASTDIPPEMVQPAPKPLDHYVLGKQALKKKKYKLALKHLSAIDNKAPKAPNAQYMLGALYYRMKRPEEAASHAQLALDMGVGRARDLLDKIKDDMLKTMAAKKKARSARTTAADVAKTDSAARAPEMPPEADVQVDADPSEAGSSAAQLADIGSAAEPAPSAEPDEQPPADESQPYSDYPELSGDRVDDYLGQFQDSPLDDEFQATETIMASDTYDFFNDIQQEDTYGDTTFDRLIENKPDLPESEPVAPQQSEPDYFALGLDDLEQKNYADALEKFIRARELDPDEPRIHYSIAVACYRMKNYDDAWHSARIAYSGGVKAAKKVLQKIKKHKQAEKKARSTAAEAGETPVDLTAEADMEPSDTPASSGGVVWGPDDLEGDAVNPEDTLSGEEFKPPEKGEVMVFDSVSELQTQPDAATAVVQDSAADEEAYDPEMDLEATDFDMVPPPADLSATGNQDEVNKYLTLGQKAVDKKDYLRAIKHFTKITELMPNDPLGFYNLAIISYRLNYYTTAKAHAQKALDLGLPAAQKILNKIESKQT